LLQSAQRAVAAIDENEDPFGEESRDGNSQQHSTTAAERAPPHVDDGDEKCRRDGGMQDSEDAGARRQISMHAESAQNSAGMAGGQHCGEATSGRRLTHR
jgi:hypothetical protein